jgi:uncharacterized membrane protein
VTILSVNKTREFDGRSAPIFVFVGADCAHFAFWEDFMRKNTHFLTRSAIIAAIYVVLTYLQYMLLPETVSGMIQFRASEALCVLAFFTPSAIPGLTVGCLVFNFTSSAVLPLDFLVGSLATLLAAGGMWLTRKLTVKGYPPLGMLMPALTNALLVGWELDFYIGGGFGINAMYVAIGELAVLLTLGSVLYGTLKTRRLSHLLFDNGR